MPRITQERRDARREQILDAARVCLQEYGLEAVSMEMIIARSGLSTGAVYRYYASKDEIMSAAMTRGTAGLAQALAPVLASPDPPPLPEFFGRLFAAGLAYAWETPKIDLPLMAIHGWSHAQSDPALKAATRANWLEMRGRFAAVAEAWQAAGTIDPQVDPDAIAQLILSIWLGFIAQGPLAGNADSEAHVAALKAINHHAAGH